MREKVDMIEVDVQLHENALVLAHDPVVDHGDYTTLADALKLVNGRLPINLELKAQKDVEAKELVQRLKKVLKNYAGEIIISSFSYGILHEARLQLPQTELAVLERWSGVRAVTKATMLHTHRLHINDKVLWSGFVRSVKHRGYDLYAYTVNHRDRAEELESWGVDGICTDYPNLFEERHTSRANQPKKK